MTDDVQNKLLELQEKLRLGREKIEKERKILLNKVSSGDVNNKREKIAYILNHFPKARNSDTELIWLYWRMFEGLERLTISKDQYETFTKPNTLIRTRATLQNKYKLFQANYDVKKYRGVLEEEKKQEIVEERPSYPLYTVHIDETGKTQDYLSVGSLWISDPKSAFFASRKLREWVQKKNIDFEFHFARLNKNHIENYKEFFLKFISLNPSVGFKVITIKRRGLKDIQNAITDLTFHLLNNGIKHENDTGRAPLPRTLQVRIDQEEEGSDMLKLENIKERIISQQIDGLEIDNFLAIDSKNNFFIQAVDLFTSAVNRKLNSSSGKRKAKDELADYILDLLNFNLDQIDRENSNVDESIVFNLSYSEEEEEISE
jgi:hypothetical protein